MTQVRSSHVYRDDQPGYLLWTRMHADAGQGLENILKRKERERLAGNGKFFWGVGNAPAVIIKSLARIKASVPVVFSKMKTKPKAIDEMPSSTMIWRQYIDLEGRVRQLPPNALITSRGESAIQKKRSHYALECFSTEPLEMSARALPFDPAAYRNASGTGASVGASQVTSLLVPLPDYSPRSATAYTVDMTSVLIGSYWVKLLDPLILPQSARELVDQADAVQDDWTDFVERLRRGASSQCVDDGMPRLL